MLLGASAGDLECDPKNNTGVPCLCIFPYTIVLSTLETISFILAVAAFVYTRRRKKIKIDKRSVVLCILFLTAFLMHYIVLLYTYAGPYNCRKIRPITSYIVFAPQAIFFLIFIWAIFKLLVIWRVMITQTKS